MDLWRIEEASIGHLVCISCLFEVIGRTFVKKTSLHHVILLVKIQGVLLLKMDLLRIEEASISHHVCILCLHEVFGRTFVKQTSIYHVILLIKIQGVLLLSMDLWRTPEASVVLGKDAVPNYMIFDELWWWKTASIKHNNENLHLRNMSVHKGSSRNLEGFFGSNPLNLKI